MAKSVIKNTQYMSEDERLEPAELQRRIGEYIAEQRLAKGYEIKKIAEDLKIRSFFLECIEQGKFDSLPGAVYTIGFIRSYTKYLDLNDEEIIAALMKTQQFTPAETAYTSYSIQNKKNFFSPWIIAASFVASAVLLGYFLASAINKDRAVKKTVALTDLSSNTTSESLTKNQTPTSPVHSLQPSTNMAIQKDHFYIRVKLPTWIKITDVDGKIVISSMLTTEKAFDITDYDKKLLTVGNAQALDFFMGESFISNVLSKKDLEYKILENLPINIHQLQELTKNSNPDLKNNTPISLHKKDNKLNLDRVNISKQQLATTDEAED